MIFSGFYKPGRGRENGEGGTGEGKGGPGRRGGGESWAWARGLSHGP